MKNYCILFLGLVWSVVVHGQNLSDLSYGEDDAFEVMTWNLENFPKEGSITVDSVQTIINALEIDIIGLQEIDDTTSLRFLVDQLPAYEMKIVPGFFNGLVYVYNKNTVQVNAVYKIYNSSQYWDILLRSPVVMECTFGEKDFIIINNHYKCCGDGNLEEGDFDDEEGIRYESNRLIKEYIDENFDDDQVIMLGDLNDDIADFPDDNVFEMFLEDAENYKFVDEDIAKGTSAFWSFPNWPSHLDHILITNELFDEFAIEGSDVQTLRIDDNMGGFPFYDSRITDHRPVVVKFKGFPVATKEWGISKPLSIYPNPNQGQFTVDLSSFSEVVEVTIYDVFGQLILKQELEGSSQRSIQLDAASGIYSVRIFSGGEQYVAKMVVK